MLIGLSPGLAQAQTFGEWSLAAEIGGVGKITIRDVIRGADRFVAAATDEGEGQILISADGISWEMIPVESTPNAVAWNGELYIAMGWDGYETSVDGEHWVHHQLDLQVEQVGINGVEWIDGYFYALGSCWNPHSKAIIIRSPDGISWTGCNCPFNKGIAKWTYTESYYAIVQHDEQLVAIGSWMACTAGGPIFATSQDGLSWKRVVDDRLPDQFDSVSEVIWDRDRFLGVGTRGHIYTSQTGSSWSVNSCGTEANLVKVEQIGDQLLAVGQNGTIVISRDRSNWEQLPVAPVSEDELFHIVRTGTQLLAYDYHGGVYSLPVIMPLGDRPENDYLVPVVVRGEGQQGTTWATDLVLHNRGPGRAITNLYLLESLPVGDTRAVQVAVPEQASLHLQDLLLSSFASGIGAGALLVAADQPLILSSKTYAPGPDGTTGQQIPGFDLSQVVTGTDPVTLIQLTDSSAFRTNIGFSSVSSSELTIDVDLFLADGTGVGQLSVVLPPFGHTQIGNVLWSNAGMTGDWFAVVSSPDGNAAYFPYASRVDNRSGDPIFNAPVAAADEPLYIPVAAHLDGLNDTAWRTDMEICSPAGWSSRVRVDLLASDQDNTMPESVWLNIDSGTCHRYEDILDDQFGFSGTAALRITPEQGRLMVSSHTYNDRGGETYGQLVPALPASTALTAGEEALLVQLSHSADATTGFRTNTGFASASEQTAQVQVSLYSGDGTYLGGRRVDLPPFSARQRSDIFRNVSDQDLDDAYAIVRPIGEQAMVFAYASVVDNRNGDSIFIRAVRPPGPEAAAVR
jgi:hypothetical protein